MKIEQLLSHNDESHRNTPCYSISFGRLKLLVSYTTTVGASYPGGLVAKHQHFSKTTGRHYSELGLRDAEKLGDDEFNLVALEALARQCLTVRREALEGAKNLRREMAEARKRVKAADTMIAKAKKEHVALDKEERAFRKELKQRDMGRLIRERAEVLGKPLHRDIANLILAHFGRRPDTIWGNLVRGGYPTLGYDSVKAVVRYLKTGEGDVEALKLKGQVRGQ